jgi:hypothetical protein
MDTFKSIDVANATVTVTDDGRGAVLSFWTTAAQPRAIQAAMSRDLLERLLLVAERELRQKPKPARGHS